MPDTHDVINNNTQQPENTLNQLIEKLKNCRTVYEMNLIVCDILNFLKTHEDFILQNKKYIELLVSELFRHCQFCKDFYVFFNKVLECAEKTGDADTLTKVYMGLRNFIDNNKNIAIVEDGIRKLLLLKSYNNAAELYLNLVSENMEKISIEKRLFYCNEALKLLDKSTVKYAAAMSLYKYLNLEYSGRNDIVMHYNSFCTQAKRSDEKTTLSFTCICDTRWSRGIKNPLCHYLPVISGYYYTTTDPINYNKDKTIIDESLSVGESINIEGGVFTYISNNAIVTTQIGEFHECHVFSYNRNGKTIENYFAPNIGLVRVVVKQNETRVYEPLYEYEICKYTLKGGEGLFPLHIGNKWCYRQCSCPGWVGQIIEREIIATDGNYYNISGLDYIYFKPEAYDTTDVATIFNIAQNTYQSIEIKLYKELLHRIETPQVLEITRYRLDLTNRFMNKRSNGRFIYFKISSISVDSRYTNDNKKCLVQRFHNISHAADYVNSAVRVFRQASFIGGKLYDPLWLPGYEQNFTVQIQTEDRTMILPEAALWDESLSYEQWLTAQTQDEGTIINLPATVRVSHAGTVEVLSGIFNNCIKVELTCQKPDNTCYFHQNQHFLHQSPFDVCGKKTIYYTPDVGIIRAEYNWDGLLYTVELSEYYNMSFNGDYMPVYYGNYWCYKVIDDKLPISISLKYTVSLPPEGNNSEFMLFEEYCKILNKN